MERGIKFNLNGLLRSNERTNMTREIIDSVKEVSDTFISRKHDEGYCLHTPQSESFRKTQTEDNDIYSDLDYTYLQNLRARALALVSYLKSNKNYNKWSSNWALLESNLSRKEYGFGRLKASHEDVAHVVNKGDKIEFRIRDKSGKYIPINIYQYVMCHELAHMATNDLQHTNGFWDLLSIMTFAMFEMGFFNFQKLRKFHGYYTSNGQSILSLDSIKQDIKRGAMILKDINKSQDYNLYLKVLAES